MRKNDGYMRGRKCKVQKMRAFHSDENRFFRRRNDGLGNRTDSLHSMKDRKAEMSQMRFALETRKSCPCPYVGIQRLRRRSKEEQ